MVRGTYNYLDALQELVEGYNSFKHRAIGLTPKEVTLDGEQYLLQRLYGVCLRPARRLIHFVVGDHVRLNKKHAVL